jgi:hypothetical protein
MLTDYLHLVTCAGDLTARNFQPLGDAQSAGLMDNDSNPLGIPQSKLTSTNRNPNDSRK